nr:DUF4398 domain-containing protein [Gammaproteobacteria bacterium]
MKNTAKLRWYRTMSVIGIAAVVITGCTSIPAPTEQIASSRMAVSSAASAGGNEFASAEMRAARDKLDRAIDAMTSEDYESARLLAEQAEVDAQLAASKARSAKAQKAAAAVQEDSRVLRKEIDRKSP